MEAGHVAGGSGALLYDDIGRDWYATFVASAGCARTTVVGRHGVVAGSPRVVLHGDGEVAVGGVTGRVGGGAGDVGRAQGEKSAGGRHTVGTGQAAVVSSAQGEVDHAAGDAGGNVAGDGAGAGDLWPLGVVDD